MKSEALSSEVRRGICPAPRQPAQRLGLLNTLYAQSQVDTARKEVNRKKALEIATNMVKTLQEYPPAIRTNLNIKTD